MSWTKVASLSKLAPGTAIEVIVDRKPYAICHVDGEIRALEGVCIHRGGPLGQGTIHEGRIVCPFHMWEFDCRTGEYDYDPNLRLATYPVKVEGDDIWIEVP